MCGHGHDRARPVAHQDVVGDPDRDRLAVDGIDGKPPSRDTVLLLLLTLDFRARSAAAHVVEHRRLVLGPGNELRHQRVLRRQREERRTEQRVRPGREDRQLLSASVDAEHHARAVRAPDPVSLHRQHTLRPVLEQVHLVQQLVGVLRMRKNHCVRFLASTSAPQRSQRPSITCSFASTVWSFGHHLTEAPPCGTRDLARRSAETATVSSGSTRGRASRPRAPSRSPSPCGHLLANRRDVALRDDARVPAFLDRGVLGRQAERVVSHRAQHLHAAAPLHVRDHVADRVVQRVPHVEVARRVREHLDHVGLSAFGVQLVEVGGRDMERLLGGPDLLPFRLDRLWVVALHLSC